jgi:hypothetical protein
MMRFCTKSSKYSVAAPRLPRGHTYHAAATAERRRELAQSRSCGHFVRVEVADAAAAAMAGWRRCYTDASTNTDIVAS